MTSGLLEGTRVLDLTIFLAGPLPIAILADFGAEVIKVEAIQRLDGFRAYGTPSLASVEAAYERSPLFNSANHNKRGITLNLAAPEGVRLLIADYHCMYGNQNCSTAHLGPLTAGGRNYSGAGAANGYRAERQG